jgi:hypothetical protein
MFFTSKVKRNQKFVMGLPDGIFRLDPKSRKNPEHQIIQSNLKFSQKKHVLYLKSQKEPKIYEGLPDGICRLDSKS